MLMSQVDFKAGVLVACFWSSVLVEPTIKLVKGGTQLPANHLGSWLFLFDTLQIIVYVCVTVCDFVC